MTAIRIIQITLFNLWFEINPKTVLYLHGELVYPLVWVYYLQHLLGSVAALSKARNCHFHETT